MSLLSLTLLARENPNDFQNCTLETCALSSSFWYYRPSLIANSILLSLFSLVLLGFMAAYIATRRCRTFTLALSACCILEILGYLGRIMSWSNPWHQGGFLMQIICLTIGPSFMAGGIYLCLRNIVYAFGKENSRIQPETYTRLFIPCDVVSLVLQALGGGMASAASHAGRSSALGDHIMVAGLALQSLTLGTFIVKVPSVNLYAKTVLTGVKGICSDFALRTMKSSHELDPKFSTLRSSWKFRGFLTALSIAIICIFIRSVYRVAELSEGWTGHLIRQQWLFVGLEGVMVVIAVLALSFFNPAFCFGEGMGVETSFSVLLRFNRRSDRKRDDGADAALESGSGSLETKE